MESRTIAMKVEKSTLVSELQQIIKSWINEKPKIRSVAGLARATRVTDATIRRLLNTNAKIVDDSILKLLVHVFESHTFDAISASLATKPETLKWFHRHYSFMKAAPSPLFQYSPIAEEMAVNPMAFSVYSTVLIFSKVSPDYIKDQFGMRGIVELEKMISKDILFVKDNNIYIKKDLYLKIQKTQMVRLMPDLMKFFFKEDHIINAYLLEIRTVSKKGYQELMSLYSKLSHEMVALFDKNPGDIPIIAAGFLDSFTTQPYFKDDIK